MERKLVINGKFLSVPMTGVHRVAQELANALAALADEGRFSGAEIWLPRDGVERAKDIRLPQRIVRPLRGIPWEQIVLPLAARGRTVLNLCNIAPVAATNAVTMIHDAQVYISPGSYSRAFGAWYRMTQPLIASRHRHLLTVSQFSKQELVKAGLGNADKISVVHNGVDHITATPADPAVMARLQLRSRKFAIGLASTQVHKNVSLLLRVFSDPRLAKLKLVLIGGRSREDFAPIGPVPPNVIFSGRVSDGELRCLYEQALCVTFPSTTEGFGFPPMEGLRVGCPAIVAPCGALPEVCASAALYAGESCAETWIDTLLELVRNDSLHAQLSRAGRAHASAFTWRRSAEQLLGVLDRIGAVAATPLANCRQVAA